MRKLSCCSLVFLKGFGVHYSSSGLRLARRDAIPVPEVQQGLWTSQTLEKELGESI